MNRDDPVVRLATLLVWKHYRRRGLKVFVFPVALALLFTALVVGTALSPGALTPSTQRSIDELVSSYFVDVDGAFGHSLALFLLQGPYLLALFAGMIGVQVGTKMATQLVSSGRFELLLAAPYDRRQVFHGLLAGTMLMTLLQLSVFAVLAIGGPLLFLVSSGVGVTGEFDSLLGLAFVLPVPIALWASLVAILGTLGVGGGRFEDASDALSLIGIAPGLALVLVVTYWPTVDLFVLAAVALLAAAGLTVACSYWVTRRFSAEYVLPS